MNNSICSIRSFERMVKSFKKYAPKQIRGNPHINKYHVITYFMEGSVFDDSYFDLLLSRLTNSFKSNPYKTKSGYHTPFHRAHFWVSYTIQDETGKRYYGKDFKNKEIVFKIHMQFENHRKKRIACWRVPINIR